MESRIAGSSLGGDVQETGRVLTIGDGKSFISFSFYTCLIISFRYRACIWFEECSGYVPNFTDVITILSGINCLVIIHHIAGKYNVCILSFHLF